MWAILVIILQYLNNITKLFCPADNNNKKKKLKSGNPDANNPILKKMKSWELGFLGSHAKLSLGNINLNTHDGVLFQKPLIEIIPNIDINAMIKFLNFQR